MDIVCAILFANVCVGGGDGATKLAIDEGGLFGNAYMEAKGWRAQVELHTDYLQRLIPAKLTPVCAGDRCVGYFKSCQEKAALPTCTWYFDRGSRWIRVEADDLPALAAAEDRISIIPDGMAHGARPIRLSTMGKVTLGNPYCHSPGSESREVELNVEAYSGGKTLGPITPPTDDISRYYPARLSRMQKDGEVHLHCKQGTAQLTACAVTSESPEGYGLGQSAANMAKIFRAPFPETTQGVDLAITYHITGQGLVADCHSG